MMLYHRRDAVKIHAPQYGSQHLTNTLARQQLSDCIILGKVNSRSMAADVGFIMGGPFHGLGFA